MAHQGHQGHQGHQATDGQQRRQHVQNGPTTQEEDGAEPALAITSSRDVVTMLDGWETLRKPPCFMGKSTMNGDFPKLIDGWETLFVAPWPSSH